MAIDIGTLDTFPKLLMHHARVRGGKPAIREKDLGIWQTWTWRRFADEVRALACGLAAQGLKRGEHIALVGDNRPRIYAAMCAAQCLGAIPVPLYQDAVAAEMAFPIQNAQITHAVAEDQEQVDKLLEILPQCPTLKHIYYDDPRGMRHYTQAEVASYEESDGKDKASIRLFSTPRSPRAAAPTPRRCSSPPARPAPPKGVVLTHHALIDRAQGGRRDGAPGRRRRGARLPAAGLDRAEHLFLRAALRHRLLHLLPGVGRDGDDRHARDRADLLLRAAARARGAAHPGVDPHGGRAPRPSAGCTGTSWRSRNRVGGAMLDGRPVSIADRFLYFLGNILVYGPLRNVLGMSRVRVAYTAGEAIGPDLFKFYRSLGINLKQLYGSTETSVFVCIQPDGQVKADTVGPAVPGVELKFTPERELLIRSPGLFKEYYKNPQATRRGEGRRRLVPHRRRRLLRPGRPPQDHRPREGRRQARRRHAVRAEVPREQAQVLPLHQGGGVLRPRPRQGLRVHQHRHRRGRQLGREAQHALLGLHRPRLARRGVRPGARVHRAGQRRPRRGAGARELADPPLPHPAQGARRRRRRAHAHAQGAPRATSASGTRRWCRRCTTAGRRCTSRRRCKYEDGRTGTFSADLKIRDAKTFPPAAAKHAA